MTQNYRMRSLPTRWKCRCNQLAPVRKLGINGVGGNGGNFCRGQNQSVWLDSREEGWGGNLMNFILSERDVLGLRASTIRGEISGIRPFHMVSGKNDFARVGARWEFLLKGLTTANETVNRRFPYNTELIEFGRRNLRSENQEVAINSTGRGQPR